MTIIQKVMCDFCHKEMSFGAAVPFVVTIQTPDGAAVLHFDTSRCLRDYAIGAEQEDDPLAFARTGEKAWIVSAYEA